MIRSLQITNPLGEVLVLELESPEKSGFSVLDIDGLGPVKATINTSQLLSVDGSIFNSARVSERNITMKLRFMGSPTIEETRHLAYKFFPIKKNVDLKIVSDKRTALTSGYIEENDPDIFSNKEGTFISIICPEAFLRSENIVETVFSGTTSGFSFPFSNDSLISKEIIFGDLTLDTSASILYLGDADTGVKIFIHFIGPATGLSIYNVDRRETMDISSDKLVALTGSGFIAGDDVEISTLKGNKTITLIRSGERINILNCLNVSADWFQIQKGDNLFTFTADTGQTNVQLKVQHQLLFEGI
jgi:hypothetical protein